MIATHVTRRKTSSRIKCECDHDSQNKDVLDKTHIYDDTIEKLKVYSITNS